MNRKPINSVGLSSLLMVFMVLCLATFAALALSTVSADQNLAKRTRATVEEYYQAQNEMQTFLYELDHLLLKTGQEHPRDYKGTLLSGLSSLLEGRGHYDAVSDTIVYEQKTGSRTQLSAMIRLMPQGAQQRYEVLSVTCQPITEQLDKTQNLWNGD